MTPEQEKVYKLGKLLGWTCKMGGWLDKDRKIIADPGWNPYNNVHDAMIAFQMIRESHFWCCLKIDCDYNYVTYISLTPSYFSNKKYFDKKKAAKEDNGHKPAIVVQETEGDNGQLGLANLAALICKAVIKAKEYEKAAKSGSLDNFDGMGDI